MRPGGPRLIRQRQIGAGNIGWFHHPCGVHSVQGAVSKTGTRPANDCKWVCHLSPRHSGLLAFPQDGRI